MSTKSQFQLSCSHPRNTVYLIIKGNKRPGYVPETIAFTAEVSLIGPARNLAWLTAISFPRIEIFICQVLSDLCVRLLDRPVSLRARRHESRRIAPKPNCSCTCHKYKSMNCGFRSVLVEGFDATPSGAQEPDESLDNKSGVFTTRP